MFVCYCYICLFVLLGFFLMLAFWGFFKRRTQHIFINNYVGVRLRDRSYQLHISVLVPEPERSPMISAPIWNRSPSLVLFVFIFIKHILSLISCISFQPVLHDWCNKGRGLCYPVWDAGYKRTLAVNRKKVAHVAAAGFLSHYQNGP